MSAVGDARKRQVAVESWTYPSRPTAAQVELVLAPIVALATRADDVFGQSRNITPESLWAAIEQARQVTK